MQVAKVPDESSGGVSVLFSIPGRVVKRHTVMTVSFERRDDFISIPPGKAIVGKHVVVLQTRGIDSSGTYRLGVSYRSPIWEEWAPKGLQVWTREMGELRSKEIVIEVSG